MGIWTEAVITCILREDTPQQVVDVLNYLNNPIEDYQHIDTPLHPFFQRADWYMTLAMDCAYFPGETVYILKPSESSNAYHLTLRCKVKYGELVTGLLHWLAPYIATQGFIGYKREDELEAIILIYVKNYKAYYAEITSMQWREVTEDRSSRVGLGRTIEHLYRPSWYCYSFGCVEQRSGLLITQHCIQSFKING
jgi:hypothetical protein